MKMLNLTGNNEKQKQLVVSNGFIVGSKRVGESTRDAHSYQSNVFHFHVGFC